MNKVILSGRMTKDVEVRSTPNNVAVANGTIAVNRNFKNKNGEYETDFLDFIAYGKLVEILSNQSRKGILCEIVGRLQKRSYDNKDGKRVYVMEIICEDYTRLEPLEARASNTSYEQEHNFVGNSSPLFGAELHGEELPF
ncbi:single-stranded DNA-binding protein [Streptococcus suis]|uniref:single-stranded DNA-binding protein n=1 Tax=Streptococcus suis TaxID=1307 RepID=UPI0038B979F1